VVEFTGAQTLNHLVKVAITLVNIVKWSNFRQSQGGYLGAKPAGKMI